MKKYGTLIVVTILFSFILGCNSDDTPSPDKKGEWKRLNDFPGEARNGSLSFVLNGKGYMLLGNTPNGYLREVWEYDPDKDSWTQKKDYPYGGPPVAALSINNKGYMMVFSSAVYEYDPVADSWEFKSKLSNDVRSIVSAFTIGGKGYFGTGYNLDDQNNLTAMRDLWMFDPVANTWTRKADFPGVPRITTVAFAIGSKGYMGMGISGTGTPPGMYTDFYEYDPGADTWTKKKDFPMSQTSVAFTFANDRAGYAGVSDNTETPLLYKYDPPTDKWYPDTRFPSTKYLDPAAFTIGSRTFLVGGFFSGNSKEVWELIP